MTPSNRHILLKILRDTKDNPILVNPNTETMSVFDSFAINPNSDGSFNLERGSRIEMGIKAIELGTDVEAVVSLMTWKDFEGFVAQVLSENGFSCIESYRRVGKALLKGMEIDVIGVRGKTIISVDAKMWGVRSGKSSAIKTAAEKQNERTRQLANELQRVADRVQNMDTGKYELLSVLVTWLVEDLEFHDGLPVVPFFKLNSFLLEFDKHRELMQSHVGHL
ncbi:MAG: hypothetical protein ACXADL_02440 [Candidatus Thorarchaeota archaeon]|jgi:Holliday junction resolvase-like predicted endonuclease